MNATVQNDTAYKNKMSFQLNSHLGVMMGVNIDGRITQGANNEGSPLSSMVEFMDTQHKLVQTDSGLLG